MFICYDYWKEFMKTKMDHKMRLG